MVTSLAEVWRVLSVERPGVADSPDDGLPPARRK